LSRSRCSIRLPLLTALIAAIALPAHSVGASATKRDSVIISGSGRFGSFQVGLTTEREIVKTAGSPAERVVSDSHGSAGVLGWFLVYRCGRGCSTSYAIWRRTGRLTDFETNSPRVATPRGTRIGMSAREAEQRERRRFGPACGSWDAIRVGNMRIYRDQGRVVRFLFLSRRGSVYPDGEC
jgi:hypothetical protein